jgi:hypothetical protein
VSLGVETLWPLRCGIAQHAAEVSDAEPGAPEIGRDEKREHKIGIGEIRAAQIRTPETNTG